MGTFVHTSRAADAASPYHTARVDSFVSLGYSVDFAAVLVCASDFRFRFTSWPRIQQDERSLSR